MSVNSINKVNGVNATQEVFKLGDQHNLMRQQETDYKSTYESVDKIENTAISSAVSSKEDANENSHSTEKLREISEALVGYNKSLVIEKDPENAGYIYKTIDNSTGEVVKIWPEAQFLDKIASLQDVDTRGVLMNKLV